MEIQHFIADVGPFLRTFMGPTASVHVDFYVLLEFFYQSVKKGKNGLGQ